MSTETIPGPFGEIQAASTAGGGTALTTSATYIALPPGTKHISLLPRNFATATVVQVLKNPWLTILRTQDALATEPTNYSYEAHLGGVVLSSQGTAAQNDFLYVGSHIPFSGVHVDVGDANGNASVITVKYRKNDNTWADIADTDGTASGGASLAQDGDITWDIPGDWISCRLFDAGDTDLNAGFAMQDMWWTRWEWSAALDASVTLDSMLAINRSTSYMELLPGVGWQEAVTVGPGGISCLQVATDAGTANLIVNVAARGRFA